MDIVKSQVILAKTEVRACQIQQPRRTTDATVQMGATEILVTVGF